MNVVANTNLIAMGVQPGWFCRHSMCSIWFEVQDVFADALVCSSRNPKNQTEYIAVGERYSSLQEVSPVVPNGYSWIKGSGATREKNFLR